MIIKQNDLNLSDFLSLERLLKRLAPNIEANKNYTYTKIMDYKPNLLVKITSNSDPFFKSYSFFDYLFFLRELLNTNKINKDQYIIYISRLITFTVNKESSNAFLTNLIEIFVVNPKDLSHLSHKLIHLQNNYSVLIKDDFTGFILPINCKFFIKISYKR